MILCVCVCSLYQHIWVVIYQQRCFQCSLVLTYVCWRAHTMKHHLSLMADDNMRCRFVLCDYMWDKALEMFCIACHSRKHDASYLPSCFICSETKLNSQSLLLFFRLWLCAGNNATTQFKEAHFQVHGLLICVPGHSNDISDLNNLGLSHRSDHFVITDECPVKRHWLYKHWCWWSIRHGFSISSRKSWMTWLDCPCYLDVLIFLAVFLLLI